MFTGGEQRASLEKGRDRGSFRFVNGWAVRVFGFFVLASLLVKSGRGFIGAQDR